MLSFGTNEGRCGHWLHPCDTPLNAEVTIKGQTCWLECLQFPGDVVLKRWISYSTARCGDFWIGDSTGETQKSMSHHGAKPTAEVAWRCASIKHGKVWQCGDGRCRTHLPNHRAAWCGKQSQSQLRGDENRWGDGIFEVAGLFHSESMLLQVRPLGSFEIIYPLIISHSHGKWPIYRWCSL